MISPQIPLYKPTTGSRLVTEEVTRPLLSTRTSIFYKAKGEVRFIETTIAEVYKKAQKSLSAEFGSGKVVVKGSAVARLFSGEPAEDVDMHYVVDLTHLPEREKIKRGYDLKWALLRGIIELIKEKLPAEEKDGVILTEDILFTEKGYIPNKKPPFSFNVHCLSFSGSLLECTLSSVIYPLEQSQRGFDFNCGALELYLDEGGRSYLGSYLPDMDNTLSEIKRREITCDSPEEITRKGLCRYMAKLVISGYYDKEISLFTSLLDTEIKKCSEETPEAISKSILKTLAAHFREKNIPPASLYLFLWLMKGETPLLKTLSKQAKEFLVLELSPLTAPDIRALCRLVVANKKAETSWFLLMQATSVRRVIQRGEACLQIELPVKGVSSDHSPVESVFIHVPIEGLKMLSELSFAQGFISLQNGENRIEVKGEDTKVCIQELLRDTLSKPTLFQAFVTAMQKFALKRDDSFFLQFLPWFEGLPEEEKQTLPFFCVTQFIESMPDNVVLRPSTSLSLMKLIHKPRTDSFNKIAVSKLLASLIFQLLKGGKFESLEEQDKEMIKAYGRGLALDFLENRREPLKEIEGEFKKIAAIIFMLYQKGSGDMLLALGAAEGCLEIGAIHQTYKFLHAVVTKESTLNQSILFGFFLKLSRIHPLEFTKFAITNLHIIQEKMFSFNSIVDSLFYQLGGSQVSNELFDQFLQLLDEMGIEELKDIYKNEVFENAVAGDKNYEALFNKMKEVWNLSSLDFIHSEEITPARLLFLDAQADFRNRYAEDPLFAKEIGLKAASLGLDPIAINVASGLAEKSPIASLEVLQSYLAGKGLCKPVFFVSLEILGKMLAPTPGLIDEEPFRTFLHQRLGILQSLLVSSSLSRSGEIEEEALESLRIFHRIVVLDTLEHDCWQTLWSYIEKKRLVVEDWIPSKKIGDMLGRINPKGNIVSLLRTFSLDLQFLIEFVRGVQGISADKRDDYTPILFLTFKMGENELLVKTRKIDPKTYEAAQVLHELLTQFYKETEVASPDLPVIHTALIFLTFSALFGDKALRGKVRETILSLVTNTGPVLQLYIKNSIHPKSIILCCLDKALEEKDLPEIHELTKIYNSWRFDQILAGSVICSEMAILSSRCEVIHKYLKELFRDPLQNARMELESAEFALLGFYAIYLDELVRAQRAYETNDTLKGQSIFLDPAFGSENPPIYKHLTDFLDFFKQKKLIPPYEVAVTIAGSMERQIERDGIAPIYQKYLPIVTELIESATKKPLTSKNTLFSIRVLFGSIYVLQAEGEKQGKVLFSSSQLLPFLKVIRTAMPEIENSAMSTADERPTRSAVGDILHVVDDAQTAFFLYSDQILLLEATLTKEDAESYLSDWAKSIISRKETVTLDELNLFSLSTSRFDPRAYRSENMLSILPRFQKKLFVHQNYFNSPFVIKNYISIIDIALSKYMPHFLKYYVDSRQVNVFTLLPFYNEYILQGIVDQRNIPEKENLQISYILALAKVLPLPQNTFLSNPAMKAIINFLFGKKGNAFFELRKYPEAKLPFAKQLAIFHLLVQHLPCLLYTDPKIARVYFLILKNTYENGIAFKNKGFSSEQIKEIETILQSPKEIAGAMEEAIMQEAKDPKCVIA